MDAPRIALNEPCGVGKADIRNEQAMNILAFLRKLFTSRSLALRLPPDRPLPKIPSHRPLQEANEQRMNRIEARLRALELEANVLGRRRRDG